MFRTHKLGALLAAGLIAAAPLSVLLVPQLAMAQSQPGAAPDATAQATPATPSADAAAPTAMAPEEKKEVVNNPYGLDSLIREGDWVARSTLVILLIMSMGSWYIMVTKYFEQMKLYQQARDANKSFWTAPTVQAGTDSLKTTSPFRYLADSALNATAKHDGLLGNVELNDWVTMSIGRAQDNVQNRLQDGLAFLATVGSTAPFVGLFGTVWGIYHALTAIGIAGQASIDKVAGPVGEALIMTAIGLAVAVPAVLGYNWLVRRNKTAMERVRAFGSDLHSVLLGAGETSKA